LLAAGSVHLLTASGALWGLLALERIGRGEIEGALGFMVLATAIDAADGPLARRFEVARVLPAIDGALLDNLVDYLNYVVVPACLIYRAVPLPDGWGGACAALIVVCSAFQFSQAEAKTHDHFFTGFPSYWNIVAVYLLLLGWSPGVAAATIVALCLLVFVPIRFVHPSRTPVLRTMTLVLCGLWAGCIGVAILRYPEPALGLLHVSLGFLVYYTLLSLALTRRRQAASTHPERGPPDEADGSERADGGGRRGSR
jgi:phosphatidylcholine synthase